MTKPKMRDKLLSTTSCLLGEKGDDPWGLYGENLLGQILI